MYRCSVDDVDTVGFESYEVDRRWTCGVEYFEYELKLLLICSLYPSYL